jgi:hypothetical protein
VFITKFNRIRPDAYVAYVDAGCEDMSWTAATAGAHAPPSHAASQRIGFTAMPLACLVRACVLALAVLC